MTGPIDPLRRAQSPRRNAERRSSGRRVADKADAASPPPPVDIADATTASTTLPATAVAPVSAKAGAAAYSAQILGQGGHKRGLRAGPEALGSARSAYLGAEWSGRSDRRTGKGRITKTEI